MIKNGLSVADEQSAFQKIIQLNKKSLSSRDAIKKFLESINADSNFYHIAMKAMKTSSVGKGIIQPLKNTNETFFIKRYVADWYWQWGERAPTKAEMNSHISGNRLTVNDMLSLMQSIHSKFESNPTPLDQIQSRRQAVEQIWSYFPEYPAPEFATGIDEEDLSSIIKDFSISQNYPNPFNTETTIEYQLPNSSDVSLRIYNIMGQLVKTLVNRNQPVGYYSIQWNGRNDKGDNVSSGIYLYRLNVKDFDQTKKLVLLR